MVGETYWVVLTGNLETPRYLTLSATSKNSPKSKLSRSVIAEYRGLWYLIVDFVLEKMWEEKFSSVPLKKLDIHFLQKREAVLGCLTAFEVNIVAR
jgi:hypothetical protein